MRHPGMDLRIVVNVAESPKEGQRTYEALKKACETFLKISLPLAGIIRRDAKVKDAIRHQAPTLVRHPNSTAAEDVERIAKDLIAGT